MISEPAPRHPDGSGLWSRWSAIWLWCPAAIKTLWPGRPGHEGPSSGPNVRAQRRVRRAPATRRPARPRARARCRRSSCGSGPNSRPRARRRRPGAIAARPPAWPRAAGPPGRSRGFSASATMRPVMWWASRKGMSRLRTSQSARSVAVEKPAPGDRRHALRHRLEVLDHAGHGGEHDLDACRRRRRAAPCPPACPWNRSSGRPFITVSSGHEGADDAARSCRAPARRRRGCASAASCWSRSSSGPAGGRSRRAPTSR